MFLKSEALRHLLGGLVQRVVHLLAINFADDVERAVRCHGFLLGSWATHCASPTRSFSPPPLRHSDARESCHLGGMCGVRGTKPLITASKLFMGARGHPGLDVSVRH